MALDYEKIRKDMRNEGYNPKVAQLAKIFVDIHANRTHFIKLFRSKTPSFKSGIQIG